MSLLGTTVGRIRLIDLAGKGGMGEVFVGYDETLERKVAVKCVSPRFRLNQAVTGRILREARILSRLDHPNICKIYDFLQEEQGDFLVMELIQGQSLGQAIRKGLDTKAKLQIAVQIADVLVATHAEGVIHRDLKPENVMITDSGEVKVLDFGIARSPEVDEINTVFAEGEEVEAIPQSARYTQGGTLIQDSRPETASDGGESPHRASNLAGTPRYMSPEQARSEPNTPASDMYTFGLLLQELFTERSPLDRHPLPELMMAVSEGRSRPVEGLGGDLTRLIDRLKSLNPSRRPTARETADRLRWIRDTPKRWLWRALATVALLMIAAGIGKYTLDLRREREIAVVARGQAEDLVAFMLEDLADELRPSGQLELLEKVARQALDYYGRSEPDSAGAGATFLRGTAFRHAGEVLADLGEIEAAREALVSAEHIHRDLVSRDPGRTEWQLALAADLLQLARVHTSLGQRDLSASSVGEALEISERMAERFPEDLVVREALGEAYYSLGIHHLFFENSRAELAFLRALEIYEALLAVEPDEGRFRFRLAVLHGQGLSQIYRERNQTAESFAAVQRSYAEFEHLTSHHSFNSRWQHGFAWENRRLGEHHIRQERWPEALERYRKAQEITRRLLQFEPSKVDWRYGLSVDASSIAAIYRAMGDLKGATEAIREGLAICDQLLTAEPANTQFVYCRTADLVSLGEIHAEQGQTDLARATWEQALETTTPHIGDLESADEFVLEAHATVLIYLGRIEEARPLVEHLLQTGWLLEDPEDPFRQLCQEHGLLG